MSDSVDRQAAIDVVNRYDFRCPKYMERFATELRDAMKADITDDLEDLPSVQPEQKSGRWEKVYGDHVRIGHRPWAVCCSECGMIGGGTRYCPNCGAKMEVEDG